MSKDDDSSAHLYHSTDQPLVLDAETLEPPSKKAPLDLEAIEERTRQWSVSPRMRLSCALVEQDIPALTRAVRRLLAERDEVTHALDSTGYNREDWTQAEVVQLLGNVITEGKERISSLTVEVERLKEPASIEEQYRYEESEEPTAHTTKFFGRLYDNDSFIYGIGSELAQRIVTLLNNYSADPKRR